MPQRGVMAAERGERDAAFVRFVAVVDEEARHGMQSPPLAPPRHRDRTPISHPDPAQGYARFSFMAVTAAQLVGRAAEISSLDDLLGELSRGSAGAVAVVGEPGIGKTRLLAELAAHAEERRCLVLAGSAAELESDLPFWVFVDALDDYVHGVEPHRLDALDADARAQLGHVLPALASDGGVPAERFRMHRAVRDLLAALADAKPLVLILDDLHWADSGSIELVASLVRRPPERVLLAFAVRPRQVPERLAGVVERVTRLEVGQLSADEARELLGGDVAAGVYEESGGNPFYLQQLARFPGRGATAALADELALLQPDARRLLEGAAVAGDPFEPELAAAASGVPEALALDALDQLLGSDLIRPTDVPRRFRFRHPLVRSAVYEAAPAGWRLGAHERCAQALATLGAPVAARAHHVEQAGRQGDADAVAVLRAAGDEVASRTPAGAARWYAAALRLLPASAPAEQRIGLLMASAAALAAAARFDEAGATLAEAERLVPAQAYGPRAQIVNAAALVDGLMGRHEAAHARLARVVAAIDDVPAPEAVALLAHLSANAIYRESYDETAVWAGRAHEIAARAGEPALSAVADAVFALGCALAGRTEEALPHHDEAARFLDALPDAALAPLVGSLSMLSSCDLYLGRFADGAARSARALTVARATGQVTLFPTFAPVQAWLLFAQGRLADAADVLEAAVEAARLAGSTHGLTWVLFTRTINALYRGDIELALASGEEAIALSDRLDSHGIVSTWAHVTYAAVLAENGEPARALELVAAHAGGPPLPRVPGIWRAFYLDRFAAAWLAVGRPAEADAAARTAETVGEATGVGFAAMAARRARARVALAGGDAAGAATHALASAATAEAIGAPVEAALSRIVAGSALAAAGDAERAAAELERAAAELDACGAVRYRDAAERELGRLGRRRHRRTQPGARDGAGVDSLTARELEVARLIVDRRTNAQIAAALFLSQKTVETHVRNLFHKLDVSSRVEVARVVERADRANGA
jgi:DNA-binding NarL/FixJ family response regulator